MGFGALLANFNGNQNTAVGFGALALSVGASGVTAVGSLALNNFAGAVHVNGQEDTAVGFRALAANQGAAAGMTEGNAAFGDSALGAYNGATLDDSGNTALGSQALANAVSGERNTAVGRRAIDALVNGNANTAVGNNTGGSYLGAESGNILIGTLCQGIAADNRTTRIADEQSSFAGFQALHCFIGGIGSNPKPYVAPFNHTVSINPATGELAIYTDVFPQVAQELKDTAEKQAARIALQEAQIKALTAQLKEQAAQIQKVSAQLEVNKPAAKVVVNKP
jgi:hypothetical protein